MSGIRLLGAGLMLACLTLPSSSPSPLIEHGGADGQLTAHEWGTFTSVAGPDGQPTPWTALGPSPDLPAFVEHFRDQNFKCSLSETIRMETPVLYFYAPHETTVAVNVTFARGVITEWYPHADDVQRTDTEGSIRWDHVRLVPGDQPALPSANPESHYYAARNTAATPLRVTAPSGDQNEKFLFYRGVSAGSLPISAQVTPDGKVRLRNLGPEDIEGMMLIESRGGKFGYRPIPKLQNEANLDPPELTATEDAMFRHLEQILEDQGLYVDEARAMLATWRNSWLEDGSRLLYIVPPKTVNAVLPLAISPAPAAIVRVFVGRLELITPTTENAVETAFAAHDQNTLDKYRRFLVPVLDAMIARCREADRRRTLQQYMNFAYGFACRSYAAQR